MLVTLPAGVDRSRVLELLRAASLTISNNSGHQDRYVEWVWDTGRMLRGQVARSDLDQLCFTPAFYRLLDPALMGTPQGRQLLETELYERQALFAAAYKTLKVHLDTWTAAVGKVLAVVDSSVFLSHPAWTQNDDPAAVIASIPWAEVLSVGFEDLLLVLPEVVIRELDRLKESGNQKTRYRAQVTLAVIDRLLPNPYGTVTIRDKDDDWGAITTRGETPRGAVQLRVFYDDPAHRPLTDPDAEIIERVAVVQALAGKAVPLVTMDTGMGLNARRAGLVVHKPAREIEAPQAEGQSVRARRRAAAEAGENGRGTAVPGLPGGRAPAERADAN
jgi:hypothetical protein